MLQLSRWKVTLVVLSVLFGVLFALPNLLPASARANYPGFLPSQTVNLGLDLQGGSYLLLEVDVVAMRREQLSNMVEDIRTNLRTDRIAAQPSLSNGVVRIRVNDPAQKAAAKRVIERLADTSTGTPDFTVAEDSDGTLRLDYARGSAEARATRAVQQSIEIIRKRVDPDGTKEISLARQGAIRIVLAAPGNTDPDGLREAIGQTAKLTFQMLDESMTAEQAQTTGAPPGSQLLPQPDNPAEPMVLVRRRVLVSGEDLSAAFLTQDQSNRPAIGFRFNGNGARRFGDATARNIGKRFAIVLDGKVISAPVIQSAITGGNGIIEGSFTSEEAIKLSNLLEGGALPAPLTIEEQRTVGAELGSDAIEQGTVSLIVALVCVLVFMVLAYGLLFGGISVIALTVNGLLIIAVMTMVGAALTLPGIAGLILTLAVAVDANVLIYERMRDEVRAGRPPIVAMEAGFSRAMETIMDANLTTLMAAAIMFFAGAGPVRGFAWTLAIGVFTSVFTAVLITQVLLAWWFRTFRPKTLPIA